MLAQWCGGERRRLAPRRSRLQFWFCLDSACSSMYLCGVYWAALAPLCSLKACEWVGRQLLIVSVWLRACLCVVCQPCVGAQAYPGSCDGWNGPWIPCNTDSRVRVSTHGGWMLISVGMGTLLGVQLLLVAKNRVQMRTNFINLTKKKTNPLLCRNVHNLSQQF